MINIVVIEGRLARDPEILVNKKEYVKFRIAHQDKSKVKYIDCLCFHSSTIGYIKRYFKKGCLVLINGKISSYEYQDPRGNYIKSTVVCVDKSDGALLLKKPKDATPTMDIVQEIGMPDTPPKYENDL